MPDWINFAELRKQLDFSAVLKHYNIALEPKGDQHIAQCPLPNHGKGDGKSFSANLSKGVWQCFGCKQSGNVLDFAVLVSGHDKRDGNAVRKVAGELRERFLGKREKPRARFKRPEPEERTRVPKQSEREREDQKREPARPERIVVNQPLDFALKTLEPKHSFFEERKLTEETVNHFGLGFCKRGSLSGRIAVPLVDDGQQLVAYAGLATDDQTVTAANPRYQLPPPRELDGVRHVFDPTRFLYNGFRVARAVQDLIIVQYCHTVWSLWQGGFTNVVALMGDFCGDEQAEFVGLVTSSAARIWLLTDSSAKSDECGKSVLPKIAVMRLCRWIRFEEEAEMAPDHPLLAALPKR